MPRSLRLLERTAKRQAQPLAAPAGADPAHGWIAMIDRYFEWGERLQRQPPALGCPMRMRLR